MAKSVAERIVKIRQHFAKLEAKQSSVVTVSETDTET